MNKTLCVQVIGSALVLWLVSGCSFIRPNPTAVPIPIIEPTTASIPTLQPSTAPSPLVVPLPSLAATLIVPSQPSIIPTNSPTRTQSATPTNSASKDQTSVSTTRTPTPSAIENPQVTQAKQDLAKRLSINASQIELVSFESVTWPDGSLGCPQPGMFYTQMVVEGYRIRLRASGRVYEYHSNRAGAPFLCDKPE